MQTGALELHTTSELISELMRRTTFLGVVVHSEEEFKNRDWKGERVFKVHFNSNLDREQARRLLDAVSDRLARPGC
jgi:hypothetical protein